MPDFDTIEDKVRTCCASSLSTLPAPWYQIIDAPDWKRSTKASSSANNASGRSQDGLQQTFNAHADRALVERYRSGNFSTINAMLGDHGTGIIPKHQGKSVCLTWALKGECSTGCRRKDTHVRCGLSVLEALHGMLDTCGVARA